MQNILISTDCVADVPSEMIKKYDIGIIYYTIKTDGGQFIDTYEVTASNIMEYMVGGEKKALSIIPSTKEYKQFFEEKLKKYDEIIHISISGGVSEAFDNATEASKQIEYSQRHIHVIDSRHLSSGQGLLVIQASLLKEQGKSVDEIIGYVNYLIPRVSTSFLTYNMDYLYYNGKVSKKVMDLCQNLHLHPVLTMTDGELTVRSFYLGTYEGAVKNYLKKIIKKKNNIQKDIGFITYAGCTNKNLEIINQTIQEKVHFETLIEQQASASISCNCGPYTFGILYIRNN